MSSSSSKSKNFELVKNFSAHNLLSLISIGFKKKSWNLHFKLSLRQGMIKSTPTEGRRRKIKHDFKAQKCSHDLLLTLTAKLIGHKIFYFFIRLGNFIEHIVYAFSGAQSEKQDRQHTNFRGSYVLMEQDQNISLFEI